MLLPVFSQEDFEVNYTGNGTHYYADKMVGSLGPYGRQREHFDNVKLWQSDWKITCNYAVIYFETKKSALQGNVIFTQENFMMMSPKAEFIETEKMSYASGGVKIIENNKILTSSTAKYNISNKIADFDNNVKVEDDSLLLYSNKLKYERLSQNVFAKEKVRIKLKQNATYLLCDTFDYFKKEKYYRAVGNPKLFKIDSSYKSDNKLGFDTLTITSQQVYANQDSTNQTINFLKDVRITRGDLRAIADTSIFDNVSQVIKLYGKPVIWYGEYQITGDSIFMLLKNNKLNEIQSYNNAFASSIEDSNFKEYKNQLSGINIFIKIEEDKIQGIRCLGQAKSLYFIPSNKKKYDAKINDSKDILISFDNGELDNIKWIKDINGLVVPAKQVKKNPKSYYLPNFKWYDNKPNKEILKFLYQ